MRLNENGTVRLAGLQSEVFFAVMLLGPVYQKYGLELVITAGTEMYYADGRRIHMIGSKHGTGEAVDLRSRDVPKACWTRFVADCRAALTPEFDFVVEGHHFHLELDVKDTT
jgi:hypothetical protein